MRVVILVSLTYKLPGSFLGQTGGRRTHENAAYDNPDNGFGISDRLRHGWWRVLLVLRSGLSELWRRRRKRLSYFTRHYVVLSRNSPSSLSLRRGIAFRDRIHES